MTWEAWYSDPGWADPATPSVHTASASFVPLFSLFLALVLKHFPLHSPHTQFFGIQLKATEPRTSLQQDLSPFPQQVTGIFANGPARGNGNLITAPQLEASVPGGVHSLPSLGPRRKKQSAG